MIEIIIPLIVVAFVLEYIDSTLGMGYGTTLTPVLLMFGFPVLAIVPSILLSEFVTGITAGIGHKLAGNVEFRIDKKKIRKSSRDIKIAGALAATSIIGVLCGVFISINLPSFYLKMYIGLLVLACGILVLATRKKKLNFSRSRILGIGLLASFNKTISGGGYGPLVTSGQVLSGMSAKKAIAATSLAEGFTCLVAILLFLGTNASVEWYLAPSLMIGAMLSVPFSVITVKKSGLKKMTLLVGVATVLLGTLTIVKLFL